MVHNILLPQGHGKTLMCTAMTKHCHDLYFNVDSREIRRLKVEGIIRLNKSIVVDFDSINKCNYRSIEELANYYNYKRDIHMFIFKSPSPDDYEFEIMKMLDCISGPENRIQLIRVSAKASIKQQEASRG